MIIYYFMDYMLYLILKIAVLTALNVVSVFNAPVCLLTACLKYFKLF